MINNADLIKNIAESTGETQVAVKKIVKEFWNTVIKYVKDGEEVKFFGVGKFYKKHRQSRKGRNPSTGESIMIPESDKFAFKSAVKFG